MHVGLRHRCPALPSRSLCRIELPVCTATRHLFACSSDSCSSFEMTTVSPASRPCPFAGFSPACLDPAAGSRGASRGPLCAPVSGRAAFLAAVPSPSPRASGLQCAASAAGARGACLTLRTPRGSAGLLPAFPPATLGLVLRCCRVRLALASAGALLSACVLLRFRVARCSRKGRGRLLPHSLPRNRLRLHSVHIAGLQLGACVDESAPGRWSPATTLLLPAGTVAPVFWRTSGLRFLEIPT